MKVVNHPFSGAIVSFKECIQCKKTSDLLFLNEMMMKNVCFRSDLLTHMANKHPPRSAWCVRRRTKGWWFHPFAKLVAHRFKHDKRASFINSILKIKSFDLKFMIKLSDFRGLEDDLAWGWWILNLPRYLDHCELQGCWGRCGNKNHPCCQANNNRSGNLKQCHPCLQERHFEGDSANWE